MSPSPQISIVLALASNYQSMLYMKETGLMEAMGREWLTIERRLDADIALLAREFADRAAEGRAITQQMVWKMERYQAIRVKMEGELRRFANQTAPGIISQYQGEYAALGIDQAKAMLNATVGPTGTYWTQINTQAVEGLIGVSGDGSPLRELLIASYGDASTGMVNALVNGVARGFNPAQVAKEMVAGFGMGLNRALLIARTETARAYRIGSAEQYRASKVVSGFKRLVHKETACLACLMLDGEMFDVYEDMDDHPNGKCIMVPIVPGAPEPTWQSGKAWFEGLTSDRQREKMGTAMYEAWKDGQFALTDLAKKGWNDTWGAAPRVPSLKELVGVSSKQADLTTSQLNAAFDDLFGKVKGKKPKSLADVLDEPKVKKVKAPKPVQGSPNPLAPVVPVDEQALLTRNYETLAELKDRGAYHELTQLRDRVAKTPLAQKHDVYLEAMRGSEGVAGLNEYTGSGYYQMNGYLRDPKYPLTARQRRKVLRDIEKLDDLLMSVPPIPGDMLTFRGVTSPLSSMAHPLKVGEVFIDKAFLSTSVVKGVQFPGDTQFEIMVPKGTRGAAYVEVVSGLSEYEMLFAKGMKFRVVDILPQGGGKSLVRLLCLGR